MKTTKDVVLEYYSAFDKKSGWEKLITDDVGFIGPGGSVKGKEPFIELTNKFIMGVTKAKVKSIITEGNSAAAITIYDLALPTGNKMKLQVSEFVELKGQKIKSFEIYYDTSKLNEFMKLMDNN